MNTQPALPTGATTYRSVVVRLGINYCVEVPEAIVRALLAAAGKRAAPVQIKATLNGHAFDANVVRRSGAWWLYLNGGVRAETGVGAGDSAQVGLEYDPAKRMPPMPEALKEALASDGQRQAAWRLQPRQRRKVVLTYLDSLRSAAARDRAVRHVVQHLEARTLPQLVNEITNDRG